ncbi:sulfotransferase family protein [Falsiroseomonas sp. CW058]|uniref:sulfotransferase family protein n=1 Tax=Falsiroseomonas sp. CW058 TaxID=3388664 RepID=UPI003D31CE55
MAPQRTALMILGMHRSGTSALARVLGLHGLALPRDAMAGKPENPRGFWEPAPAQKLNDRILAAVGSAWDDPRPLPRPLAPQDRLSAWQAEAAAVLAEQFAGTAPLVLKDPRIARLARLWRGAVAARGIAPKAVLAIRNPLEVAASLEARNGIGLDQAMRLWLGHVLEAERGSRGLPRAVVHYDMLLRDWAGAVAPALRLLPDGAARPDAAAIAAFLGPELRHHAVATDTLLRHPKVPGAVKLAYAEFRRHPGGGALDEELLDLLHRRFAEGLATP